jgi:hypothetical protein
LIFQVYNISNLTEREGKRKFMAIAMNSWGVYPHLACLPVYLPYGMYAGFTSRLAGSLLPYPLVFVEIP